MGDIRALLFLIKHKRSNQTIPVFQYLRRMKCGTKKFPIPPQVNFIPNIFAYYSSLVRLFEYSSTVHSFFIFCCILFPVKSYSADLRPKNHVKLKFL